MKNDWSSHRFALTLSRSKVRRGSTVVGGGGEEDGAMPVVVIAGGGTRSAIGERWRGGLKLKLLETIHSNF